MHSNIARNLYSRNCQFQEIRISKLLTFAKKFHRNCVKLTYFVRISLKSTFNLSHAIFNCCHVDIQKSMIWTFSWWRSNTCFIIIFFWIRIARNVNSESFANKQKISNELKFFSYSSSLMFTKMKSNMMLKKLRVNKC